MKKCNLSTIKIYSIILLGLFAIECTKKEDDYQGKNEIYITTSDNPVLIAGEDQTLNVKITLTQKVEKDTPLNIILTNTSKAGQEVAEIIPNPVIIKKGERNGNAKIKIKEKVSILQDCLLEASTNHLPEKNMIIKKNLRFTVKPSIKIQELTKEQILLLEAYKKKGMDIVPFLGKVKVNVKVTNTKETNLKGFEEKWTKTYESLTVIALSEKATTEKPTLKMIQNPMGLTEFFHYMMRKETIENDEYWYGEYAAPNSKKVMELINWNKTSKETFTASLDNILIEPQKEGISKISYLGKRKDSYGDEITVVPFSFKYTAWDRLKKLIDEKNKEAIECHEGGASSYPENYINNTSIDKDEYEESGWKETSGQINYKEKTMQFEFCTSFSDGSDYIRVLATYTLL